MLPFPGKSGTRRHGPLAPEHENTNSGLQKLFHPSLVWCTRELNHGYLLEPGEFIVGHTQLWVL